jgi:transcriptional repressor NrdR
MGEMRCPWCSADDDRVVDSRVADEGSAIRRRRECQGCGQRFTTFERVEEVPLWIVKRDGSKEPFDRAKVVRGVTAACKNRPVEPAAIDLLVAGVEDDLRDLVGEVTSEAVGKTVLEHLGKVDQVAYVRFASVYKGFDDIGDFQREVGALIKSTQPKARS